MKQIATIAIAAVLFIPCLVLLLILLLALMVWKCVNWLNRNHEKASESMRDAAKASRVVAALAALWAWLLAPTGLAAVGASLGIASTSLIVVLAPVLLAIAGAALTVSTALELYSKWRKRQSVSS
jgi:hypothetical protein